MMRTKTMIFLIAFSVTQMASGASADIRPIIDLMT